VSKYLSLDQKLIPIEVRTERCLEVLSPNNSRKYKHSGHFYVE